MMSPVVSTFASRKAGALPEIVTESLAGDHPLRGAVLILGNFDGLHVGHQQLVHMAHGIAGKHPVSVMSCEPHPRSFFATQDEPFRLATPSAKRLLMAPYGVDFIYSPRFNRSFAGMSPGEFVDDILVEAVGVRHVIAGPDFRFGNKRSGDMRMLSELGALRGFGVSIAPEVAHAGIRVSSTLIRTAIRSGDLRGAARFLGGEWLVETRRRGDGSLELHPDLCRPRAGRYVGFPERAGYQPDRIRIDITPEGGFIPLSPYPLQSAPEMWRLETQD